MIEYQELVNDLYNALKGKSVPFFRADEEGFLLDKEGGLLAFDHPLGAQLEITSRCNLKCLHCYNNSGACTHSEDLTDEEWLRVAEELRDMKVLAITISGGEPFLKPNLLQRLIETFAINTCTVIGVVTNGSLVDESFIDWFGSLPIRKFVQVSIDGANPEEHDWLRGVGGSWERAVRTAYRLSRARIGVRIAHTCTKKNLRNLEKMVELSVLIGCENFVTGPVLDAGRAFLNRENLLLDEADQGVFAKLVDDCIGTYSRYVRINKATECAGYYVRFATLPTAAVLIRPDGKVKIDCTVPVVFGSIREKRFREIWNEAAKY